jgi:hypothetical protein
MRPNLEVIFLRTEVRRLADKRLCDPLPRLLLLYAHISPPDEFIATEPRSQYGFHQHLRR